MRKNRKRFVTLIACLLVIAMSFSAYALEYVGPTGGNPDGTPVQPAVQPVVPQKVYEGPASAGQTQANPDGTVQGQVPDAQVAAAPETTQAQAVETAAVHTNPYHHTCVEIDLTNQMLYAFDGETLVLQSPCVTGTKGSRDTSVGDWKVLSKETDRYLRGTNADGSKYKSWVSYWMPFHGGQGMHDSSWRGTSHANYGGNIYTYDGSHGCVNLPFDMAQALFNFVHVGTPVHVHN